MTDLELMRDMLCRREIPFEELNWVVDTMPNRKVLRIEGGYSGFFSDITFSEDGALLTVEAGE